MRKEWIMALIKCPECGKEISDKSKKCVHCGYVIKSRKPVVIGILIILVIVVMLLLVARNNVDHGYFDNNKWGMSREEIEKKYGDRITESFLNEDALAQYTSSYMGVENLNSMVQFEFNDNDELYQIFLMILNESQMSNSEVYNMVADKYTKAYGDSEETEYGLIWKTDKTQITMKQYPGNSNGTMILYTKLGE